MYLIPFQAFSPLGWDALHALPNALEAPARGCSQIQEAAGHSYQNRSEKIRSEEDGSLLWY
jgi:hypothetical protein